MSTIQIMLRSSSKSMSRHLKNSSSFFGSAIFVLHSSLGRLILVVLGMTKYLTSRIKWKETDSMSGWLLRRLGFWARDQLSAVAESAEVGPFIFFRSFFCQSRCHFVRGVDWFQFIAEAHNYADLSRDQDMN